MAKVVQKIVVTLVLLPLVAGLLVYGLRQYRIRDNNTTENVTGGLGEDKVGIFPGVLYRMGLRAQANTDYDRAEAYFAKAVTSDVYHMESWLRLAETAASKGERGRAQDILTFVAKQTEGVMRWKWQQMLLAQELGFEDLFVGSANPLLGHPRWRNDTFQLLNMHYGNDAEMMLDVVAAEHRIAFLRWLMRWNRLEDSLLVWAQIAQTDMPEENVSLGYANYLLSRKEVGKAADIWQEVTGNTGITNGGFEREVTHRAFDWRYRKSNPGKWTVRRVTSTVRSGIYALQVDFKGNENVSFYNVYQIVPVDEPGAHELTYTWKSRDISTDQGPFVEVYGYQCKGLYQKGAMMLGSNVWQEETIGFDVPEMCEAIVVRVRRLPSKRFDSLIAGTVWVDDFRLAAVDNED